MVFRNAAAAVVFCFVRKEREQDTHSFVVEVNWRQTRWILCMQFIVVFVSLLLLLFARAVVHIDGMPCHVAVCLARIHPNGCVIRDWSGIFCVFFYSLFSVCFAIAKMCLTDARTRKKYSKIRAWKKWKTISAWSWLSQRWSDDDRRRLLG